MVVEISLKIKNEEKTLTKKQLDYSEGIVLSWEDSTLSLLSEQARKEFDAPIDDEVVSIKMLR